MGDPNTTALTNVHKSGGAYGLAYSYEFGSNGDTGIGKSVAADWRDFSAVKMGGR